MYKKKLIYYDLLFRSCRFNDIHNCSGIFALFFRRRHNHRKFSFRIIHLLYELDCSSWIYCDSACNWNRLFDTPRLLDEDRFYKKNMKTMKTMKDISKLHQLYRMDIQLILENEPEARIKAIMIYNDEDLSQHCVDIYNKDGKLIVELANRFVQDVDWNNMVFFLEKDSFSRSGAYYDKLMNYIKELL